MSDPVQADPDTALSVDHDPEVIVVDGLAFRAFSTESDMNSYTLAEESKRAALSAGGGSRHSATGRRSTKCSTVTSASSVSATDLLPAVINANINSREPLLPSSSLAQIPPPPPLYKMMCKSGGPTKGLSSSGSQQASAFKSDLLDEYLARSKHEISSQDLEELGSPPEDSPIYSTGTLKMSPTPDVVRKPFADLPLLSRGTTAPSSSICPKRPRPRWPSPEPKQLLQQQISQNVTAIGAEPKTAALKVKQAPGKKANKLPSLPDPIHKDSTAAESYFPIPELEDRFEALQSHAREYSVQNAKNYNVSFKMDECYVRYGLDALKIPDDEELASSSKEKPDDEVDGSKAADENNGASKAKKRRGNVSDIATMISRHSKRDIRLPARFHHSGMMVGNQWIVPDYGEEEPKRGRRRFVDEQRRLQITQKSRASDAPNTLNPPPALKITKTKSLSLLARQQSSSLLSPSGSQINPYKAFKKSRKPIQQPNELEQHMHRDRLEQIQGRNQQLKNMSSNEASTSSSSPVEHRKGINRLIKTMPRPTANPNAVVNANGRVQPMAGRPLTILKSSAQTQKMSELRELYRHLFFENRPERRHAYQMRGVKPRVNKMAVVKESIQVVRRLKVQDEQQSHFINCLKMWQDRLSKCLKIMLSKDGTYDEEKKQESVANFLEQYKKSSLVQVCEELEKRAKAAKEAKEAKEQEIQLKKKQQKLKLESQNNQLQQTKQIIHTATEPKQVVHQQPHVPIVIPHFQARSNIEPSHVRNERPLAIKLDKGLPATDQQLRTIACPTTQQQQATPNINLSFNNHMSVKRLPGTQEGSAVRGSKIYVIQVPAGTNLQHILAAQLGTNQ